MRKFTKIFAGVLCLMMALTLVGCGSKGGSKSKGNCGLFECMEKISTDGTIEDINKVIGFTGELKEKSDESSTYKWELYRWDLNEEEAVEVKYYTETKLMYVESIYSRDSLKNKKVDISSVKEDMKKINSKDGLKYDDVKKIVGGVDGNLVKKDNSTLTYQWYNSNGGSFTARFSTTSGKCTSYNGVF